MTNLLEVTSPDLHHYELNDIRAFIDVFIHTFGDAHLYSNHMEQAAEQLSRTPGPRPTMRLNPEVRGIFDFAFEDFQLEGYEAHPHISAPVAV